MIKKTILAVCGLWLATLINAQNIHSIINAKEVERIEKTLSSNEMRGRRAFSPDIDKAAAFIANEFKQTGLQTFNKNSSSYLQQFSMLSLKSSSTQCVMDGVNEDANNVIVVSPKKELTVNEQSGFEVVSITKSDENFRQKITNILRSNKNTLVLIDTSFAKMFPRLKFNARQLYANSPNIIFILTSNSPKTFSIHATQNFTEQKLSNVVGIIPGKTKPNEYVIFSGHYDHLGVGKPVNGDSIYNGANDDASGTTAVITLAKYFKALHNNERTLVFVTFTAEEIGGFGSQYFSKQFNPAQVVAMFNIEMIGTESKWGANSAYITGYEKTDMGKILQSNLQGTNFAFYPDPYTTQNLFYRSDNATLARLGVPAHTISTSKMDDEPNYHKVSDEIETLDMNNMAEIIKAIALSSKEIIGGKQTPARVDAKSLN